MKVAYTVDKTIAEFEIDEEHHPMQRSIMRAMMTDHDNPTIKFIVVSEPLADEIETKDCTEVGFVQIFLIPYF